MRRSAAPSIRKLSSPVYGITEPLSNLQKVNSESATSNVVRSTSSILDILNNKKVIEETNASEADVCSNDENIPSNTTRRVFNVVFGKKTTKKHKTWEEDGILEVTESSATLKDTEGKFIGKASNINTKPFEEGYILSVGGKQVQIIDLMINQSTGDKKRKIPEDKCNVASAKRQRNKLNSVNMANIIKSRPIKKSHISGPVQPLVLPMPTYEHQWQENTNKKCVTNLTVPSFLTKVLRSHQRTGVVFLYECIMGWKQTDYYGAILADEMGLGKTLQCITVIWTLLKQGPYGGVPVIKKVIIVTPSSLTGNWKKEFTTWLGRERIEIFTVDTKHKPKDYLESSTPIMIISYEMFLRYCKDIENITFDLMVCDEGHRLKNDSIKLSVCLSRLDCKRKIILTGTPIQNDLREFYSLVNFVNPGILGSLAEYRRYFEDPIVVSREPNASEDIKRLGEIRANELNKNTSGFILRRTQEILQKFLPTKTETVIFCKSSCLQQQIYTAVVEFWNNRDSLTVMMHLKVMMALKKCCNHPFLLKHNECNEDILLDYLSKILPKNQQISTYDSGKLQVLNGFLQNLRKRNEKTVIVSSFTQTLDMISEFCDTQNYKYCRLDGSTPSQQRTSIVECFNRQSSDYFIFLLSAKAGGVGLNLIGASRLVLFDSDWNPATDLQAMSRVWRDGQKKSVFLYRFLTTGTIEEKIYQRQISKTGLSGTIVDPNNANSIRLSDEELKDLFNLQFDINCCSTHLSLNCKCQCDGSIPEPIGLKENQEKQRSCQLGSNDKVFDHSLKMNQLLQWEHHGPPFSEELLKNLELSNSEDSISFIFCNKCTL